jgi:hypothetical protein
MKEGKQRRKREITNQTEKQGEKGSSKLNTKKRERRATINLTKKGKQGENYIKVLAP